MVQIQQVTQDEFDWTSEEGPAADVRRIARAATAHDGTFTLNEQALLQLKNRGLREASLWLASSTEDAPAEGFAFLHGDCLLDLAVHPDARRRGLGTALAAASLAPDHKVEAWSHVDHPGAEQIAQRFGVARERELTIMRLDGSVPLPPADLPDGVVIRTFRPEDEQALLEVNASAFAHHPEQGHMSHEDFLERTGESWFDPEGLFLALPVAAGDGPPLLGFHWTKEHRDEEPAYGEVYVVAVNPKAAGRGLGTVLTNVGLQHLRSRGLDSILLYVDGDNDPAIAVYTRQGFTVERTEVQYRGVPTFL